MVTDSKKLWQSALDPTEKIKKVHLLGAAGVGMKALKFWLDNSGFEVTGTDDFYHEDWMLPNSEIPNADCLIVTSVIRSNHPHYIWAIKNQIPIFHRAHFIKYLINNKSICVSGTHGKTTTSALTSWILYNTHLKSAFIIGDELKNLSTSTLFRSDFDVCTIESDESDGSMQKLTGSINIITNIDEDHMDFYANVDELICSFQNFSQKCARCIINYNLRDSIIGSNLVTFSLNNAQADFYATNIIEYKNDTYFDLNGKLTLKNLRLNIIGLYNVENAIASISAVFEFFQLFNISLNKLDQSIRKSLETFEGAKKRLDLYKINNVTYVFDYAHHPTAIINVLNIFKKRYNKVYLIIEVHKYIRLKQYFMELIDILSQAYCVGILPVHRVNEETDEALEENFYDLLKQKTICKRIYDIQDIKSLTNEATSQDVILFLGAGKIVKMFYELIKK
ncbi:MAG: hypothetical protein H6845_02540 [Alphaproteobacteria bacterium]|nr:MAG: hypothetical protein H6845_02540 [Alphaproteobacteria bacterium]